MNERIQPLEIPGVLLIEAASSADERGGFFEYLRAADLQIAEHSFEVAQVNCSVSVRGALRGIAVTAVPPAQAKVVACVAGEVLDVAVDLRAGSPTFLKWHAVELSEENFRVAYIPFGFAHGFQTLAADCDVQYLVSAAYAPGAEGRVRYDEPRVGVRWPLPVAFISPKDAAAPHLPPDYGGIVP